MKDVAEDEQHQGLGYSISCCKKHNEISVKQGTISQMKVCIQGNMAVAPNHLDVNLFAMSD